MILTLRKHDGSEEIVHREVGSHMAGLRILRIELSRAEWNKMFSSGLAAEWSATLLCTKLPTEPLEISIT